MKEIRKLKTRKTKTIHNPYKTWVMITILFFVSLSIGNLFRPFSNMMGTRFKIDVSEVREKTNSIHSTVKNKIYSIFKKDDSNVAPIVVKPEIEEEDVEIQICTKENSHIRDKPGLDSNRIGYSEAGTCYKSRKRSIFEAYKNKILWASVTVDNQIGYIWMGRMGYKNELFYFIPESVITDPDERIWVYKDKSLENRISYKVTYKNIIIDCKSPPDKDYIHIFIPGYPVKDAYVSKEIISTVPSCSEKMNKK